ncbi:MAG: rRNA adenine dimethylase, partial [Nitrospirales bacterium]|nr:rRNA adenine dimethylase [Nitrospirales bacterium]
ISQTGAALDELPGAIDLVPLDGSSCAGLTASSELAAHAALASLDGRRAILHGHPKFSVILSMHCLQEDCACFHDRDRCPRDCREARDVSGTPIVSGEIGTGPTGLMNTVPQAMRAGKGVIVYGHGVFTSGMDDFRAPFALLREIEETSRKEYFRRLNQLLDRLSA